MHFVEHRLTQWNDNINNRNDPSHGGACTPSRLRSYTAHRGMPSETFFATHTLTASVGY